MKNRFVEIHLPKFYKIIPIAIILNVIQKILSESITNYYKNAIINLSLTSIGQSFSIFLYIYQKYKNLDTFSFNVNKKNLNISKNTKKFYLWILGILSLCALTDILGNIKYEYLIYSQRMKIIFQTEITVSLELIFFYCLIFISEIYFLKINTHKHHILGIGINIALLIMLSVYHLIKINEFSIYTILSLFFIIILCFEKTFFRTFYCVIPKRINYEYFMNMNLISFIKSIIQTFFCLFLIYFFNDKFKYQFKSDSNIIFNNFHSNRFHILFILFYFIISCLQTIYLLKITEVSRPSYNLIPLFFSDFFCKILEIKGLDSLFFFIFTPSIIGISIFCETIILNCSNFDKYTINRIAQRGEKEVKNDVVSFINDNNENSIT